MKMLREGWWSYFKDAKAIIWMYAVSPMLLRQFLETPHGQKLLKKRLEANWTEILARGRKRREERLAMERKLKKFQMLREKQEEENTKRLGSEAS